MNKILVTNISYTVKGKQILKDLSFEVKQNEVFALIGKNGSGKSSLIDIILQDLKPDCGEVKLFEKEKFNYKNVGILYDHLPLISLLRVEEIIKYYCTVHKLKYAAIVQHFFEDFEISPIEKSYIRTLSLGEKKRVSILLAVMHNPDLLILDEPFANVDPTITNRIWNVLKRDGRTIFFTTHNWADAEKRADKVAFLGNGQLIAEPLRPAEAIKNLPAQKKLIFTSTQEIEQLLTKEAYYKHDGNIVCFSQPGSSLIGVIAQHTSNFSIQDVDLTDVYLFHLKAESHV
ncbi:ABC transporter ATP-binding protein [Ancylomarina salipaludis]|uniref:ABC transporter ATP-binding protein n=1 Tax=Ancylomarina salipaludis TaxID=2501299 RepID=A0A4Q1JP30_9BACT|nr:ABC transporter ATP-binding protein [Ancylomarina salipaludis]RXQ96648.1 ABC transporter ATP-binding protein [Ancylomarina salipaludis]